MTTVDIVVWPFLFGIGSHFLELSITMRALFLLPSLFIFFGCFQNFASAIDSGCTSQASSAVSCATNNGCGVQCGNIPTALGADTCQQFNSLFCSNFACCSECFNELETYYECLIRRQSGRDCDLECSAGLRSGLGYIVMLVAAAALAKVF